MESLDDSIDIHDSINVVYAENLFATSTQNDELEDVQATTDNQCRDGVCVLTWRPKSPEVAA